ncbi:hypothetical protein GCM10023238_14340 [Streptomyces heliomycini]
MPGRGRRSGSGTGRRGTARPAGGANGTGNGTANGTGNRGVGGPPVEDVDGVLLVRSVEDDSFPLDVVAEVAGAVGREEDVVTVIVGSAAGGGGPDADHWARLGALLDSLRARGTERVRLVMSGAGDDRPDRPSVARRIADAWELEVTAPDGAVLITPGGALFVHGDSRPGCAWWRFAPGAEPRKAGRRAPAPVWEEALDGVPARTAGGCVVDRVPAGVMIRPAGAPGPAPDDLCFSVPVDFERLTVLVGAPQAEDVAADEVAAVLKGLPEEERARTRLAPGGRRDLLRLGQSVADLLGAEVEVLTGLPLLDDHAPPGTPPRPTLVGLDGRPSWRPFVSSVVCGPVDSEGRAPVPRPVELHPPDWILGGGERGTVRLTDRWQATVTRAGLALWTPDGPRPGPLGPAVDPEVCAIELGMPGQPLDDSLLPALSRLVRGLGTDVRSRTTLLVRGRLLAGDGALRRLAAEHGIPGIRYVTAGRPARPGPAAGRPGPTAEPGRVPTARAGGPRPGRAVPTVAHGPGAAAAGVGRAVPSGAGAGGPGAVEPGGPRRSVGWFVGRVGLLFRWSRGPVPGRSVGRGRPLPTRRPADPAGLGARWGGSGIRYDPCPSGRRARHRSGPSADRCGGERSVDRRARRRSGPPRRRARRRAAGCRARGAGAPARRVLGRPPGRRDRRSERSVGRRARRVPGGPSGRGRPRPAGRRCGGPVPPGSPREGGPLPSPDSPPDPDGGTAGFEGAETRGVRARRVLGVRSAGAVRRGGRDLRIAGGRGRRRERAGGFRTRCGTGGRDAPGGHGVPVRLLGRVAPASAGEGSGPGAGRWPCRSGGGAGGRGAPVRLLGRAAPRKRR